MTPSPRLVDLLVTFGGVGRLRPAPGTWGSVATLPFAWLLHSTFGGWGPLGLSVTAFSVGWWASNHYLARTGGEDPSEVVIDEVAGQALVLAYLAPTWQGYLLGLALFRLFDILKPWPVSYADRHIGGGLGVMLDDILAGLYPVAIGAVAVMLTPRAAEWLEVVQGL